MEAREAKREYMRKYRAANKQKLLDYQRKWRKANPEKCRKYQEEYWIRQAAKGDEA